MLITAQGLLMYFQPEQAGGIVGRLRTAICALVDGVRRHRAVVQRAHDQRGAQYRRLPGAADAVGVDARERVRLADLPGVKSLERLRFPRGRGPFFGFAAPLARGHLPRPASYLIPSTILRISFAP